ncbi:hypothetical protein QM999_07825 [Pectobacterium cacticida]|uniref:hypothetical protein n=1 Tax=Pectobacterium cacticida TaxID=69221 RepID=UPI002FF0F436
MTTLSTAQLIDAMRTVADMADTEQGREKRNVIAHRMEILFAENASMNLQLNSIRAALNIPVDKTVQAGVIAETTRLNEEVLLLRSELSESVALANKLRRTAKEHQEENQLLRTELAELLERPADAEIQCMEDMTLRVINVRDGFSLGRHPVFTRPVPPTAHRPFELDGIDTDCVRDRTGRSDEYCEGFVDGLLDAERQIRERKDGDA